MKTIEIKTSQNVVLQYELAELRDRILAFVLDLVCLVVGISLLNVILGPVFYSSEVLGAFFLVFLACVFIFYSLCFEVVNNGQSIGKMALRIRVIKTQGDKATFSDYAARWVFRMVDIYFSLGCVASMLVSSSAKAQRIGDIVANTAVIKLIPKMNINLNDLMTIRSRESYEPKFLTARNLREEEALLIKSALERAKKHDNQAHRQTLRLLSDKVMRLLDIQEHPRDPQEFLITVLNDYVVLTR